METKNKAPFTPEEIEKFKGFFSMFCQNESDIKGHCNGYDCAYCEVNKAYNRIFFTAPENNKKEAIAKREGKIFFPSEYLKLMTGEDISVTDVDPVKEIENILDKHFGEGAYWSYPLEEKEYCDNEGIAVVLVDVSHFEGDERIVAYRYFEVDAKNNKEDA